MARRRRNNENVDVIDYTEGDAIKTRVIAGDRANNVEMCFARDTQHSMDDTVVSFERLNDDATEIFEIENNENDVISLSRVVQLRELLDELSRRFWCFRQKGYLYGTKLACLDCIEDLLIMDGDTVGSPAYVAYERNDLQGFEQHRYTKRCLDYVFDCEFCEQPLGAVRPVEECAICLLFDELTNRVAATTPSFSTTSTASQASRIDVSAEGNNTDDVLINQTIRFHQLNEISPIFATTITASNE